ncbi:MAG TPA: AsmA-like C-terminal region-containing protein [Alloacidobacterium sp.]|nr:AsmA-like C-terminal region-containing protein [Alloacidobacterium sp.]
MLRIVAVFLLLGIIGLVAVEVALHRAEPILRARVIDTLSTRFDSRVDLEHFHVYFLNGFEVTGSGLRIYPHQIPTTQPLFSVGQFAFRTSWHGLLHTPMYVDNVNLKGLQIHLPPKGERQNMPKLNGTSGSGKIKIFVGEIQIENATLVLGTNKPGKIPLDFEISHLTLQSVGQNQPMKFHAILTNPKPVGNIDSSGFFGPFNADSPGDSPVRGEYRFSHADLSTIKGIGGTLSSTGKYEGVLDHIVVDGETDTPNFSVDSGNHPMPLHTKFHAIVDGTNGDTYLQPVDAWLLHSHILATGDVVRAPQGGHNITLDVSVNPARIEDMLQLGVKTEPPVMSGALQMKTKFFLPPGKVSVSQKLQLKGNFEITNATFSNERVQGGVDELSLRGQGEPEKANQIDKQHPQSIQSEMLGQFELGNGKLSFSDLEYRVPGATIALQGVYTLDGNVFDFHGTARLKAKVSEMVTGWKSLLLTAVDPFLSKNGAGTEVPIKITGTRSDPQFGLDFGRKDKNNDSRNKPKQ